MSLKSLVAPVDEEEKGIRIPVSIVHSPPAKQTHGIVQVNVEGKNKRRVIFKGDVEPDGEGGIRNRISKQPIFFEIMQHREAGDDDGSDAQRHYMDFSNTPDLIRQAMPLMGRKKKLHELLDFKAPDTGNKAADIAAHGGERQWRAAGSCHAHTLKTSLDVSCLRALYTAHLIRPEDKTVCELYCKTVQKEWKELVAGTTFQCGALDCQRTHAFTDAPSYTFELLMERSTVVAAVTSFIKDEGKRVDGFEVLRLLCSPASGNIVLTCQKNVYRAELVEAVKDRIRGQVCMEE